MLHVGDGLHGKGSAVGLHATTGHSRDGRLLRGLGGGLRCLEAALDLALEAGLSDLPNEGLLYSGERLLFVARLSREGE